MRVLITGGAGFIGSNLTRLALDEGHDVTVVDDLSTGYAANLTGVPAQFYRGSVLDGLLMADAVRDVDSIVHLAALGSVPRSIEHPVTTHHVNAGGTLAVLEAARAGGVEHVVFASSSSVYGMNPVLPKDERAWVRPVSPYGTSKLAAEQYVLAYQQCYGLRSLAFRFFNVYGPRQMPGHAYAAVVPVFVDALLGGQPLYVNGDGGHSRDFTYVGDVVRLLLEAATRRTSHEEPVNLAFGTNTTLSRLIKTLESVSGRSAQVRHRDPRPGDVRASQADNTVLRRLFPGAVPTSLEDGLAHTVAWFEECAS